MTLGGLADEIAQDLVNSLFLHFDDTLREMGFTDVSVSKRLKKMKAAFYGRNAAYAKALDSRSRTDMAAALVRNVYGGEPGAGANAATFAGLCFRAGRGSVGISPRDLRQRPIPLSASARFLPELDPCPSLSVESCASIRIPSDGETFEIEANPEERVALAQAFKLPSIESLRATLTVKRAARGGARVRGTVHGELNQTCVVSLDPFPAKVEEEVDVRFAPPVEETPGRGSARRAAGRLDG